MLHRVKGFKGFAIGALDGDMGSVADCLFDDETWQVKFLVVDTGPWHLGRTVLIPPSAVDRVDWAGERVVVALTTDRVRRSPDVDAHKPVSRQHEDDLLAHYGLSALAVGASPWSPGVYLGGAPDPRRDTSDPRDRHLRSSDVVSGYGVQGIDGDLGHLRGFLLDGESWVIRYLVVETIDPASSRSALVETGWVDHISWAGRKVIVSLLRRALATAPDSDASAPVSPEDEERLASHFANPANWR